MNTDAIATRDGLNKFEWSDEQIATRDALSQQPSALVHGNFGLGDDFKARRDAALGRSKPSAASSAFDPRSWLQAGSEKLQSFYSAIPGTIEANCSWCFHTHTQHHIVQKAGPLLGRSVYKCGECHNLTVSCKQCGHSMARGHSHGTYDTNCFKCDGIIKDWNSGAAVNKQSTELTAYCSYCFERCVHALIERPLLARQIYECAGCKRKTLKCLNCEQAMCQADGVLYANSKCALCAGEIKFWEDTLLNKQSAQAHGWCSWCFEFAAHDFDEQMGTTGLVRKVYRCQECKARTLECLTCKLGMCQGTEVWDEKTCAGCAGVSWEEMKQLKDTAFNRPRTADLIRLQLSRPSEWRAKAYERGMLRPFLLLVSMTPRMRFQIGISLGWSMINTLDEFGEVHAEAYDILYHTHKGMEARCEEFWETLNPIKQVGTTRTYPRGLRVLIHACACARAHAREHAH